MGHCVTTEPARAPGARTRLSRAAVVEAAGALQIPAVTDFMNQVLAYLPNIIAAVLIFVIAAALAGALAFGLGGREVAAELWSKAYDKGQEQSDQVKQDAKTGRDRGKEQAQQARSKAGVLRAGSAP